MRRTCLCLLVVALLAAPAPAQLPDKLPSIEKAAHKDYVEKLNDKVTFDMIAIPGGVYLMGSPESEKGRRKDEGPQHPVGLKPFWMGKCEVRWDEYDLYWEKKAPPPTTDNDKLIAAVSRPTPPYTDPTFGYGREGHPVMNVTWHAAMEYCRWLSARTGKHYRLPTEAEWEWACRAGATTAYSFGDDPAKLGDHDWFVDNSEEQPQKVGEKKPNPWGLYDMHGNVSEWCIDHYEKGAYSSFPLDKVTWNPVILPSDRRYPYVARGGSWLDSPPDCRSAARRSSAKDWLKRDPQRPQSIWWMTDADYVGLRVVVAVDEQENLKNLKSKMTPDSPD